MQRLTLLDLFAGCGGLSLGLESVGFDVRWANEIDTHAAKTYKESHKNTLVWNEDANLFLKRIVEKEDGVPKIGEVDLIAGGPPCQGFSGYNRFRGPDDPRNSLVETYLAFVEVLKPRVVLMENVPGMLQMDHGKVARTILEVLVDLGYQPELGILQAGNFGLPQNRWRVFIMATLRGENPPSFPEPTYYFPKTTLFGATAFRKHVVKPNDDSPTLFGELLANVTVGDAIRDLPEIENGEGSISVEYGKQITSPYQNVLRGRATVVQNHQAKSLGDVMMERVKAVPHRPGAGWLDLPDHLRPKNLVRHGDDRYPNRFGRLWWDGIFNTIVTEANAYWGRVIHPEQDRLITVRESARAQGIPDRIKFFGPLTLQYKQVGNAVPPPLAKALGKQILKILKYPAKGDESSWVG